ncbi:tRNA guanosine(34) transglycosylase Tgt [Chitinispirillales bacterium ANBcel5]|uniref:tRNA guanosine(34) transglycosylase Tgt n=1 Tax=Cellulosispirillum alkaliphilum TaxID=3039283 RepID=UPI002A558E3B|nr:tRNA guanosine(34) transglycosylase Tgt [Chitinispirillales bacterium ANBcel5]
MDRDLFFNLLGTDPHSQARAGVFKTGHSTIETPVFMPVGTQATVKSLSPLELEQSGSSIILANTYHLHLRPGDELIRDAGGLHRFENWNRSILTDSGGFQVFSLRDISKISDDGVEFQSHIDGSRHTFSPERVMEIQHNLGADIIMVFDECPPSDAKPSAIEKAVERTLRWAGRCQEHHHKLPFHHGYPQYLFAIVQGGTSRLLRQRCARELVSMDFPGYALGGLAVGEAIETTYQIVEFSAPLLPQDKPRYLMGVGTPKDILECIERGIDMFDCVMPTRNARNGSVFTWNGKLNIRNAKHMRDFDHAIDDNCGCYACTNFSRSYIRHLYMAGEILAIRLLTLHNIHFYLELTKSARERILEGTFSQWKKDVLSVMSSKVNDAIGKV